MEIVKELLPLRLESVGKEGIWNKFSVKNKRIDKPLKETLRRVYGNSNVSHCFVQFSLAPCSLQS